MLLLAVPNIAEGRDESLVAEAATATRAARLLDVHSDRTHNRTVLTLLGRDTELVEAATGLARVTANIDMTTYDGAHPALGGLDVCPFVPYEGDLADATHAAHQAGRSIVRETGTPVFFYGHAARRVERRELPDLRRGGLAARMSDVPDEGGPIDPRRGVVCVGARGPLIAFNVMLWSKVATANAIARAVRGSTGGLHGVRALAIPFDEERTQISMNLVDPDATGIDAVFDEVQRLGAREKAEIVSTEIVGLVRERHLPDPKRRAARLLVAPGRSIESVVKL